MKTTKLERIMKLARWFVDFYGGNKKDTQAIYNQYVNPFEQNDKLTHEERALIHAMVKTHFGVEFTENELYYIEKYDLKVIKKEAEVAVVEETPVVEEVQPVEETTEVETVETQEVETNETTIDSIDFMYQSRFKDRLIDTWFSVKIKGYEYRVVLTLLSLGDDFQTLFHAYDPNLVLIERVELDKHIMDEIYEYISEHPQVRLYLLLQSF
jgi:hypothetical protein